MGIEWDIIRDKNGKIIWLHVYGFTILFLVYVVFPISLYLIKKGVI